MCQCSKFFLEFIDSDLTTLNIKTILMDGGFSAGDAEELGTFLGIKPGRISTLRTNSNGNVHQLLTAIIDEWLQIDKKSSWRKLADAVRNSVAERSCRHLLVADKILEQYCGVKRKAISKGISNVNIIPNIMYKLYIWSYEGLVFTKGMITLNIHDSSDH